MKANPVKRKTKKAARKTLSKPEIESALINLAFPNGLSPIMKPLEILVSKWNQYVALDEFNKKHPDIAAKPAVWGDDMPTLCGIDLANELFDEITIETQNAVQLAFLRGNADFFRDIAAEISKQKRIASKRKNGVKKFPLRDFQLLKQALSGKENVCQLATHLKDSGLTEKSESRESIIADLRRRRRKIGLANLSR